jgi:hypothetical protein
MQARPRLQRRTRLLERPKRSDFAQGRFLSRDSVSRTIFPQFSEQLFSHNYVSDPIASLRIKWREQYEQKKHLFVHLLTGMNSVFTESSTVKKS